MNLLSQVAAYDNLLESFKKCSNGKRNSIGYQKFLYRFSEEIDDIRKCLLKDSYRWSEYRKFAVHDPKTRIVSAPLFRDRVVHTSICNFIEPYIEQKLCSSVYACRKKMGNRNAVIELLTKLVEIGHERFTIKLDVEKYFDSIDQSILLGMVKNILPDQSLTPLISDLLASFQSSKGDGKGLPIGALTSQLFANFYLSTVDEFIHENFKNGIYIRYMDDLVLIHRDKQVTWEISSAVQEIAKERLKIEIPFYKVVPLGADPIPFLGFVVDSQTYRILSRNHKRHEKQLKRLRKTDARPSRIEQTLQSFKAWKNLEPHLSRKVGEVS